MGGGLYKHLLQAACTLATDPAPKVARIGKAALRVADVELASVPAPASQSLTPSTCSLIHSFTPCATVSSHCILDGIGSEVGMYSCNWMTMGYPGLAKSLLANRVMCFVRHSLLFICI